MQQRLWLAGWLVLAVLALGSASTRTQAARTAAAPATDTAPSVVGAIDQGGVGGEIVAVAVEASRAYVLQNSGVSVFDVSDPGRPALLTQMSLPWIPTGLAVAGGFAYTFGKSNGTVAIIDLRTPGQGQIVKTFAFGAINHRALAVSNGYLYLGSGSYPLTVVDVRDPLKPSPVGAVALPGFDYPIGIQIAGSQAYAISWGGTGGIFYAVDVSKPSAPSLKGTLALEQQPLDLVVSGNSALVTDYNGVTLIDISDPAKPIARARLELKEGASAITIEGQRAYVLYQHNFSGASTVLIVVDIQNATALQQVGQIDAPGQSVAVPVVGGLAYLANDYTTPTSLRILDVRSPAQPTPRGSARLVGDVWQVRAAGQQLAALTRQSDGSSLWSLKDSGADGLQPQGSIGLAGVPVGLAYNGSFAYAGLQTGDPLTPTGTIQAVDLTNPISPTARGSLSLESPPTDLRLVGDKLFITTNQSFQIADVSQPGQPVLRGTLSTPGGVRALAVVGTRAYLTGTSLLVVDISDVDHPALLGSSENPRGHLGTDIVVDGTHVFVAITYLSGVFPMSNDAAAQRPAQPSAGSRDPNVLIFVSFIYVYDVSNPSAPLRIGQTEGYNSPFGPLIVYGQQLICATSLGLQIVDVRDPAKPVPQPGFWGLSSVVDLDGAARQLYVSNEGGLRKMAILDRRIWLPQVQRF